MHGDKAVSVWHLLAAVISVCGVEAAVPLRSAMEQYKVVPDIIPQVPAETVQVRYGSIDLQPGQELTPRQVKDIPTVSWKAEKNDLYTLLLTDVDIPPAFGFKSFTHWLVTNVPGSDINGGTTVFEYFGSGAPEGTGLHRYIFLVYKQSGPISSNITDDIKDEKMADRGIFSIDVFAKNNELGGPVAANFFRAQYDDYVPELRKRIQEKYGF